MFFLCVFVFVCLSWQYGSVSLSKAAQKLMEDRTKSPEEIELEDDRYVEPGFHQVLSNEKVGHVSFRLDSYVLAENHPAIHGVDSQNMLAAMNLDKLPSGAESIVMKGLNPEKKDTLALVHLDKPLEDQGEYKRTATRAVYKVTEVTVFEVLRDVSARVPFRMGDYANMKPVQQANEVGEFDWDDELERWIPDCSLGDNADFDLSCYLNWDRGKEHPNAIFEEIPILIGGANMNLSGDFIFDLKDWTLKAGVEIDFGLDAQVGLYFEEKDNFEYEVTKELGPWMTNFPGLSFDVLVINVGLQVGFGVDATVGVKGVVDILIDYIYEMKITTPNSVFVGYDGGLCGIHEDDFDIQLISPDKIFKNDADDGNESLDLDIQITPYVAISPYFRAEFNCSILGASAGIGVNVGVDIDAKLTLGADTEKCTSLPYLYLDDIELNLNPFLELKTDAIDLWGITLVDEKDFGKQYFTKTRWTLSAGCFTDASSIWQKTVLTNQNKSIMVEMQSLTAEDDLPYRVEVVTSTERCSFYTFNHNQHCVLYDVDEEDVISIRFYFPSFWEIFGGINEYTGYYSTKIKDLGDSRTLTEHDSDLVKDDDWDDIETYSIGLEIFNIPEFELEPSEVENDAGKEFYSMLRIPAGYKGQIATLLNLVKEGTEEQEGDDQSIWTNGDNYLKYYPSNSLKSNAYSLYYFDTNTYEPRKFEVTSVENNGLICDLGMIYCIGKGDPLVVYNQCYNLSGETIVDISGDQYDTYPIDNGDTETEGLDRYRLNYNCDSTGSPYLVIQAAWHNNPDDYGFYTGSDLCADSTLSSDHYAKVGKSMTYFNFVLADYEIPIIYDPTGSTYEDYYVKSQTYASTNKVDYEADLSFEIEKINYTISEEESFVSEYGIVTIDVTNANIIDTEYAGIIIEISAETQIDWLKSYEDLGNNQYLIESYVAHDQENSADHYWLNIPFRFKGETTVATFTLHDIFSTAIGHSSCNLDHSADEAVFGSNSAAVIGCVLKQDNYKNSKNQTQSLVYTYSSNGTNVNGVADVLERDTYSLYTISNIPNNATIKYNYVEYVYIPDASSPSSRASSILTNNYNDGIYSIIRSNGCYKTVITTSDGTSVTLMEGEELYVDSQTNANLVQSMINNNGQAFTTCYCEPETTEKVLLYPKACMFNVNEDENTLFLLHSNTPSGIRAYGVDGDITRDTLRAFDYSQFVNFSSNTYYAYDQDGEYTYENIASDAIYVYINYNDKLGENDAVRIKVMNSTKDKQLPISRDIFNDETIMNAIVSGEIDQSHMLLGTDGILYIEKSYVNTEIDASLLLNICSPYVATSATIVSGCSDGESTNDAGNCIMCKAGYACSNGIMSVCEENTTPVDGYNRHVESGAVACLKNEVAPSINDNEFSFGQIAIICAIILVCIAGGIATGVLLYRRRYSEYRKI